MSTRCIHPRTNVYLTFNPDGCDSSDDPSRNLWSVYVTGALQYDKALVESWKGDMDGILIFVG
jgi:hypothetical protein